LRTKKSIRRLKLSFGLLAAGVGVLLAISPIGGALDNLAYDLNFLLRGSQLQSQPASENGLKSASGQVLLVAIDEASFQDLAKPWPWPRSTHAKLLESLFAHGAKAVVLDLILADPSISTEDKLLAATLRKSGPVVLATDVEKSADQNFERVISVEPLSIFKSARVTQGYAALPISNDGFVRNFGQTSLVGDPSLAQAATNAFQADMSVAYGRSEQGINFLGPSGTIKQVSYYQALSASEYLPLEVVKDKLVFVGLITQSDVLDQSASRDSYPTPYTRWGSGYMNGVEIHANAAQSILNGTQITSVSSILLALFAGILVIMCSWVTFQFPPNQTMLPLAGMFLLIVAASYYLFLNHYLYLAWPLLLLPALMVFISSPLLHYLLAWRERNFIHRAFSSYVSADIVQQLITKPELLELGGTNKQGSVLFLDLEGFTSLSEQLSPADLLALLNKYLGALSDIAIAEGGMVDKFIGDSIMVVWGTPIEVPEHAKMACSAALKMQKCMHDLGAANDSHKLNGRAIRARIGINSGEFIAGNIGGRQKLDYTVLGDSVNLASRLEAINKLYGSSIIISENTANMIGNDFAMRVIDQVRVKGKRQSVVIYEVTGFKKGENQNPTAADEYFQQARTLYQEGDFAQAAELFEKISTANVDDQVSKNLMMRCRRYAQNPPEDWQGVLDL